VPTLFLEDRSLGGTSGDGALGAGDLHEALYTIGTWILPFVPPAENNGYRVSQSWRAMRARRSLEPYVAPYGFATRAVDGNDPFAVHRATAWARAEALAGRPAMLDCHTFRMGGYSSHLAVPRPGIEAELAPWQARDPLAFLERWLSERGRAGETGAIRRAEAAGIEAAGGEAAAARRKLA
jgi:TPP-dependent pyruvate/acetoin dehydrogenase alpha subunit